MRDTGEIAPAALALHWAEGALQGLLADVALALGLDEVQAHLHNLLIYGPGQLFKPHQDTEKHPGMVATLVLVWPSAHIGGALRVVHGADEGSLQSHHLQVDSLRWCAFYADCQHEVLPVQEGWRVVLSFDLVVPARMRHGEAAAAPALVRALREQCFPEGEPSTQPWVFLLDHEYTEHGLRWQLLKGLDRARVAALRSAAQELGLVMHLALAEIHESWTATLRYRGRWYQSEERPPWPRQLPVFVQACEAAGLPAALLDQLLAQCLALRIARDREPATQTPTERNSAWRWRAQHTAELAQALAHASDRAKRWARLAGHVHMHAGLYPLLRLRQLLQAFPPQAADLPDLQGLRAAVLQALAQALHTPQPPADDHCLKGLEWTCRCKDCQAVIAWAEAPDGHSLTLPMAEARRSHVQEMLRQTGTPLSCDTVKQGSPYKLVIKKPAGLHAQRSAQRRQWQEDWEALGAGDGGAAGQRPSNHPSSAAAPNSCSRPVPAGPAARPNSTQAMKTQPSKATKPIKSSNRNIMCASTATRKYRNMKARLRTHGGVANPRDSYGYRCGLRLALGANPSLSFCSSTSRLLY